MAETQTKTQPKAIGCETCKRMAWDDGTWSKWTLPLPEIKTYHVCHDCLWSPRSCWKDIFLLSEKLGVGTVQFSPSQQVLLAGLEELSIWPHQTPEHTDGVEQYQNFEDVFEHSPLKHDQVRILSLLPGGEGIHCTIEHVDLNSAAASYEALSYCWGSSEQPKHNIWINGHPFEILDNLYAALEQLRKPKSIRKLWIDAICINQTGSQGVAEKNIQVPLMGSIYHQAAGVIVWLGAEEDGSDKVIDILARQDVKDIQTRTFATGFGRLLKRDWFRRTWIVQEFVLGKTTPQIVCGSRTVSYGKLLAMHWVLPLLRDRIPDNTWVQTKKSVDANGDVLFSQRFERKSNATLKNHDEAQETFAPLTSIRDMTLDDECRLRPRPLYKILPFIKGFSVGDPRDKIYGTFGMVSPSVRLSVQVDYHKTVAEVFQDAMTYMFREGSNEPGAADIYLEFPLSLSLDSPTPDLPSWVPDFSQNSPFLRVPEDITWYFLYHQNLTGHVPRLRKQHGRHEVTRSEIMRKHIHVDGDRLTVRGFLIDDIDSFMDSSFISHGQSSRDYADRQMRSSSEARQREGREIKETLQYYDKFSDETITEITTQETDAFFNLYISTRIDRYRIQDLYFINEHFRKKLSDTGSALDPERWLTFIWRDLFEGHPALDDISEAEFDEQFYDLAQSDKAMSGSEWFSKVLENDVRTRGLPMLNTPMRELFGPPRTIFTTASSGFYGIGPPGVKKGDRLAFLFPQAYMAFILRPAGEAFQMVGPCIVPPRHRDRALEKLHSVTNEGDEIVLI